MRAILFTILILALTSTVAFAGGDEEDAVAELTKIGAKFEYSANKRVVKVDLSNSAVKDVDLRHLVPLKKLEALDLRITKVGDDATQYLQFLKNLKFLNMFRTDLSDAGLARLKNLDKLETLLIGGTRVTDAGLKTVSRFSKLKKMSLFQTAVTDAGLKNLEKLTALEVLVIGGSKISEEGAKSIQRALPNLKFTETTT